MMDRKIINLVWLILCHVGNFMDLLLTMYAISRGVEEANPIMNWLLGISPFLFSAVKLILFSLAIEFVAKRMPSVLKWIALMYMAVVAWHVSFIFQI